MTSVKGGPSKLSTKRRKGSPEKTAQNGPNKFPGVYKRKGWGFELLPLHALPSFLRDNEFLLRSHRPQLRSLIDCCKSVFRFHTETLNIWSHLIGCVVFVFITLYCLTRPTMEISWQQKLIFLVFFVGAIFCLGASTVYHTFLCYSERVHKCLNKVDYCGILTLIVSSFAPWVHYGFYCRSTARLVYLVSIFCLGILCVIIVLQDKFSQPKFRPMRAVLFMALGLTGVVPGVHYAMSEGLVNATALAFWLILMAGLYLAGGLIYAARIPERLYPGKFDIWCQSHQILHVCVVAGALSCYHGASKLAMYRLTGILECVDPDISVL